jgi:hypothetical protein
MKLIGLMSLAEDKEVIHQIFERHGLEIFSETAINGHTISTIEKFGWFASRGDAPYYSTLCFAIIADDRARLIMDAIERLSRENPSDHPIRAFLVPVERMI